MFLLQKSNILSGTLNTIMFFVACFSFQSNVRLASVETDGESSYLVCRSIFPFSDVVRVRV